MPYVICLLIGAVAGVCGGLFGIGGGIIIVPLLILAFGMEQQMAAGTSLVALLAPVGLLAVKRYWEASQVDLQKGGILALGFIFGAYFGAGIAVNTDPVLMRRSFAGFLMVVSIYLFTKK